MAPSPPASLLIIDDHPVFRAGLRAVLAPLAATGELREAGSVPEALEALAVRTPAAATLDLQLGSGNGFAVLERARELRLPTRFVVVSLFADPSLRARALELGASAFVPKEGPIEDVVTAVRGVLAAPRPEGAAPWDEPLPDLSAHLPPLAALARLTAAERLVLQHLALNRTSSDIAARLGLSARTVQNHRAHMCEKLNLKGNNKLLEVAIALREVLGPPVG